MIDRNTLDTFIAQHKLGVEGVNAALDIAHARPSSREMRIFVVKLLRLAGLLSVAAGVIFFIAANWHSFDVYARFILVEALLVASACVAGWKPPPHLVGCASLLFAFVMTGVLLALFGQTYQTGADVYELFLTWTVLGLPFAVAARWSVSWAAWVLILNVALGLFCGMRPEAGPFWFVLAGTDLELAELLLAPMMINLSLWAVCEYAQQTRAAPLVPSWLRRLILAFALGYASWAGTLAIIGEDGADSNAAALIFVLFAFAGVAAYAVRERNDVFPLAAISGSLILLTTFGLAKAMDFDNDAIFFVLSIWLIASSTVSGRLLMKLVRSWNQEAQA